MHPSPESTDAAGYVDHVRLWQDELRAWVPPVVFDAHVHLGPAAVMGPISPARRQLPLCTFTCLTWEQLRDWYGRLFEGKHVAGLVAFPFPLQEVDIDGANDYLIELMRHAPSVKGFLLAHPTDVGRSLAACRRAERAGVRFWGVKPYFDLLGRSVFDCAAPEFIPDGLLDLMNRQRLVLMLHTSRRGMGDRENQDYLRQLFARFPDVRVVLAHMGRYIEAAEFFAFCDSGLLDCPALYLEMSSASLAQVYARALGHPGVRRRLLFGSDLPFGLITGMEAWSPRSGPIFVTRDRYAWSDPQLEEAAQVPPASLTYNTYHTIKAFKDALDELGLSAEAAAAIKQDVFCRNAAALFAER
jgi:hypothetical protein